MTLYPPTHAEIDRLLQRATRNWPHLTKRIDNAAALLRPLALAWSQTRTRLAGPQPERPHRRHVLRHRRRRLYLPRLHPRQRQSRRRPHLLQAQHRVPRLPPHPARPPARALRGRGLQRRIPPHQAGLPAHRPGAQHAPAHRPHARRRAPRHPLPLQPRHPRPRLRRRRRHGPLRTVAAPGVGRA